MEELGATSADQVTTPYITTWIAKGFKTAGASDGTPYHYENVPTNEWCYYDMDLNHYRMNYVEADGSGVDEYGMKLAASSYYQYLNLKFCSAYSYVYVGNMTFIKESTFSLTENNDVLSFGENVTLSDWYSTNVAAQYTVDGVEMDEMTALKEEHAVTVNANIFTANIGDGNYTIGDTASWAVTYTTPEAIEKTMSVEGGISADGTELINVESEVAAGTKVDLSAYSKAAALEELGFTVTQSYVKRYSDGTPLETSTVANTERGIFTATVSADNGTQSIEYDVTLDLYNSTEAVEYESFGHADSAYAVKAYYAIRDTASEWMRSQFKSYEYMSSTYVTGKQISGIDVYGMDLDFATYFKTMAYGDDGTKDTSYANYLKQAYSYNSETGTSSYTDDDVKKLTYLALDGNLIQLDSPMESADGTAKTFSSYAIDSCIYVYITPRHSKSYYTEFSSAEKMKMIYAEPRTSGSVVANFLTGVSGDVDAPTLTQTSKQNYSANWQPSLMWAYDSSNAITGIGPQSMTVETVATYYDSFANMSFPFISWNRPGGRGASSLSNELFKLGALIF